VGIVVMAASLPYLKFTLSTKQIMQLTARLWQSWPDSQFIEKDQAVNC
jgi:hypothetical protein